MEELKQDLANLYAELGIATEKHAVIKTHEQASIKYQNEIIQKIIDLKNEMRENLHEQDKGTAEGTTEENIKPTEGSE